MLISMLKVELVCRLARGSVLLFGEVQVVMVMDPMQLPPIEDRYHGDAGEFCFQSDIWKEVRNN